MCPLCVCVHPGNHDVECIPRHVLHNVMRIKSSGGPHTSYYDFEIGANIRGIVLDVFEISAFSKEGSEERYGAIKVRDCCSSGISSLSLSECVV